jgi:spoIIIJ-associated protein
MEWVETTGKTVDEAKERALDQLGVAVDDAEFDVVQEPRTGLFGLLRGEARVRARVKPTPVRPKIDRRRQRRPARGDRPAAPAETADGPRSGGDDAPAGDAASRSSRNRRRGRRGRSQDPAAETSATAANGVAGAPDAKPDAVTRRPHSPEPDEPATTAEKATEPMDQNEQASDVGAVRDAAVAFMAGLTEAFGFDTTVDSTVEGTEIEVRVDGSNLGVLIGPGGRTLLSIQDLARVAAQRRLHDHETRLRVDVAGYREKRRAALERFAATVAEQVKSTGVARSLDPMPSADRKVIHDTLAGIDGVVSRSEGEDPDRRVVVAPA